VYSFTFSALTLFVGHGEERDNELKNEVLAWLSVWSGVSEL